MESKLKKTLQTLPLLIIQHGSLSDPSLHHQRDNFLFEGFCCLLPKRPPPSLPSCRSARQPACRVPSPAYIHFAHPIQLGSRRHPARPPSNRRTASSLRGDLRPSGAQPHNPPSQPHQLCVIGKPCVLSCGRRPVTAAPSGGPGRQHLHVFLPTEAQEEAEPADEDFLDELVVKITSLRLQQEDNSELKTPP
ncbi:uncharacterized protein LOC133649650 isoform X2 [Entelurus aequoreus]|uniref:uncharacterized protein LOC133649650 isoform X2 n=1 Tax=Entelurus aequoreus TaxID=161455 RepID=UPI002B1DA3C3|nr:uncharacterized protein LOC133649650 isoform X2 [Entelurus aequoreus]